MSIEICAVVDRVPGDVAPARVLGDGPYVVVAESGGALEDRIAARVGVFRVLRDAACVPFRLGATVDDDAAALRWLEERRAAVDDALARVTRRVEFDLHLPSASAGAVDGEYLGPGTRHLRELASRYARLSERAVQVALEACRNLPAVDDTAVAEDDGFIAFLVSDSASFARATRSVRLTGARWSGPWPAFTFASRWLT